ncbi:MAG: cytochrome c oxidase cbb3-type subunit III [Gallionellaceae bacterium]|nr:MAG: cytochrome c oxidase cbb3-type subunit III [Gallionellaceae bacterium]
MSDNRNADTGETTTGHVWDDDLADYTNQPPRWWMIGLAASAIWVVVYFLMYPSIPIATSGTFTPGIGVPGTGQWTAVKEMEADMQAVNDARSKYENKLKDMTPAAILADKELSEYVARSGKVLFSDNCAGCHGQNGIGTIDKQGLFAPVLNDDDWLFGGTIEQIYESIANGRQAMMMAHKSSLSAPEIKTLAAAVAQGNPTSTPLFTEKGCVGCHGADGKGMQAMGAANLADKVWRFSGKPEDIEYTITHGVNDAGDKETRVAIMPNFTAAGKLSAVEMKKLAVYVFKFGGGKASDPAATTN